MFLSTSILLFFSLIVIEKFIICAAAGVFYNVDVFNHWTFTYDGDDDENEKFTNEIVPSAWIAPGTKWCGRGNTASSYDDLGSNVETDKCCRAHDLCEDVIPERSNRYNLTNTSFMTRSHCECDEQLRLCLKNAGTTLAKFVGFIYFHFLNIKCFKKEYPVLQCLQRGGWLKSKCLMYLYDTKREKIYQWFDVMDF